MATIESVILDVADPTAANRFYTAAFGLGTQVRLRAAVYAERGLAVAKSFSPMYVEFAAGPGAVKPALYRRRALAKDVGVAADGTGSHRLVIGGDAGPFTDPDGFAWEAASLAGAS